MNKNTTVLVDTKVTDTYILLLSYVDKELTGIDAHCKSILNANRLKLSIPSKLSWQVNTKNTQLKKICWMSSPISFIPLPYKSIFVFFV